MNKQQLMEEVFKKDPRGCSAGDIALALNKRWPSRNSENFAAANKFLKEKHEAFRKKKEEYRTQQAAMEVARDFYHTFMDKVFCGTSDEEGGFILGLKYDLPENAPKRKPVTIIRPMEGNPFMSL